MSQESDTIPPKPKAVPVARIALRAPRIPFDEVPPSESKFRERLATLPGVGAPFPAPPLPQPAPMVAPKPPSPWALLARWAAPRVLALLASAIGGGVAVPRITGDAARTEDIAQLRAEIRSLKTQQATEETNRQTDQAITAKQFAYELRLWRERGNTEVRIDDTKFPKLPQLDIQAPTDVHKPATVDTPFPTE